MNNSKFQIFFLILLKWNALKVIIKDLINFSLIKINIEKMWLFDQSYLYFMFINFFYPLIKLIFLKTMLLLLLLISVH